MLNFYQIVKENLNFNRFEFNDTVCLEYTCPIDAEHIGIYSRNDYVVHVLSGKKKYTTLSGEWTLEAGQTLYLKKGAEIIHQYFDDQYCMLGFFLSDDLIKEVFNELKSKVALNPSGKENPALGFEIETNESLDSYFHSMLAYFRGHNRPPDTILILKVKELLINLIHADPNLATYFSVIAASQKPSLRQIMENNFCYNLRLEDYAELTHRSLSSFKRDFVEQLGEAPGKWLIKRRVLHAANLISNTRLSITQIALESGFEDLSHFSRAFKKVMGVSPTDHKKS